MMVATPTKLSSEADVGRSKAQHVVILAFCSPIVDIMRSARTDGALNARLGGQTGLNDRILADISPLKKALMPVFYSSANQTAAM